MISVADALARVLAELVPLGVEQVPLDATPGRALAAPLLAARPIPPWDNSAMDGYAVRADEVQPGAPLPLVATVGAGHLPPPLPTGHAAPVMTGAPLPAGADAVIMREEADESGGAVRFRAQPTPGAHIRRAGEDVAAGDTVLEPGTTLGPGEIGIAAALGRAFLTVHRAPRVAIVSTGDELVELDRTPGPGQIYGSNGHALAAQCHAAGARPTLLPLVPDDRERIRRALAEALFADVVLSTGGVSVGDFDYVRAALADLGIEQAFWKVAMKPGKPVAFGLHEGRPVFGLPGNPAASMVGFELFVRPALRKLGGHKTLERPRAPVVLDEPYHHDGKRRHFLRAILRRDGALLRAKLNPRQGSGMLRSMVGVNALVEVPEGQAEVAAGGTLTAIVLEAV